MRKIKELIKKTEIKKSLKIERSNRDRVRILYVEPFINSDGYYRMILPYLELGKLAGFETRVTSVKKWNFVMRNKIGSGAFQEEEIRWANFIIFPMLEENYTYLFRAIKVLNPNVLLVMDITNNIHHIPHRKSDLETLLQNLSHIDMVTTPIKQLRKLYQKWLYPNTEECTDLKFFRIPSLICKIRL